KPADAARMLRDAGMRVPALVRGGFFPAFDAAARRAAIGANRVCVDEAQAIGAEQIVMAVGIAAVLPYAEQANVKLAIEPLHPMYAADRSCINRMAEARQICEQLRH